MVDLVDLVDLVTAAVLRFLAAGAAAVELSFGQLDNRVENEIDGDVFFESTVSVTASGPPLRKPVAA